MCQAKTAEGAPDRYAMDGHLVLICNFENQIIQCEIRLGSHPYRDPIPQSAQLAMTAAIALGTRLQSEVLPPRSSCEPKRLPESMRPLRTRCRCA